MVTYVIGVVPLIKCLKSEFPDVARIWYTYDSGALGTFTNIMLYFNSLK